MSTLPSFLRKYFWDIDFDGIVPEQRKTFILKRLLEYGDEQAVEWMKDNYSKNEIKEVLLSCRGLSQKTQNYWALVFELSEKEKECMNRPLSAELQTHWRF